MQLTKITFIIALVFALGSCKNENTKTMEDMVIMPSNATPTDPKNLTIPSACEMITDAQVKEILSVVGSSVTIKEANDPGNIQAKSCFFKWDDPATPNAGILIQIMTNPVYSEFPNYVSHFVSTKLTDGETQLGNDKPFTFQKISGGGSEGAFSFAQARAYWNIGNDYLFMLAFNVSTLTEAQMKDISEKVMGVVNQNFAAKIKQ